MESIRQPKRKLIVLEHDSLTRAHAPGRNVIIIETIPEGFLQMTSYCRFIRKVEECSDELIDCLKGDVAKRQIVYRWAGAEMETADKYINFPLCVAHPALSTSALRIVFPNVTLDIRRYNAVGSACNRTGELLKAYNAVYEKLELPNALARSLLAITGYFTIGYDPRAANATVWELMDAAEEPERKKYMDAFDGPEPMVKQIGSEHAALQNETRVGLWERRDKEFVWLTEES